ncbi:MAG TPA: nucleotidyltransferase substrate binding protein [Candidatus Babeliales bacterium]|nr:nucleotidyltransferase substrate binding protein [Candidatus Babeliales bacterium]
MEKLITKYEDLLRIHIALYNAIIRYNSALIDKHIDHETIEERRDSLIKRFELTYDLLWKYIREYIIVLQGVPADSPRKIFQQCSSLGITTLEETNELINLIESRNLTTHTYNIDLANDVAEDIPKHYNLIHKIIQKLSPSSVNN